MEITLEQSIIDHLSSRGVLAYVAVKMAEGTKATTAVLASLVKAQTAAMLEGLKELSLAAPGLVAKDGNKWMCGAVKFGDGEAVQILDSERFRSFVDDLQRYWEHINCKPTDPPFDPSGRDMMQIRTFLKNHREWIQDDWRVALQHRKTSVVVHHSASRTEDLYAWIPKLGSYLGSPLDPYGKPVEVSAKHDKTINIQQGNREAGRSFLTRVKERTRAEG